MHERTLKDLHHNITLLNLAWRTRGNSIHFSLKKASSYQRNFFAEINRKSRGRRPEYCFRL